MDYSPFNPVAWLTFFACLAAIYLSVKLYHRRYPNYPREMEVGEEPSYVLLGKVLRLRIFESTGGERSKEAGE